MVGSKGEIPPSPKRKSERPPTGNEYDRFENLTRKLVRVTKSEIDAKREAAKKV